MRRFTEIMVILGVSATLLALSFIGVTSFWRRNNLIATTKRVAHSRAVLKKLDDVALQLAKAAIAQRSYLLSGESQFLDTYHAAQETIQHDCTDLRALMSETIEQQLRIGALEFQTQEAFAAWQWTLDLWKSHGVKGAAQDIVAGKSAKIAEEVQNLIRVMKTEEISLLQSRLKATDRGAVNAITEISAVSVITVCMLLLAGVLLRRNSLRRARLEEALRETEARYRSLLGTVTTVAEDDMPLTVEIHTGRNGSKIIF